MRSMERIMRNNNVYAGRQGDIPELRGFYTNQKPEIREKLYKMDLDNTRCTPGSQMLAQHRN